MPHGAGLVQQLGVGDVFLQRQHVHDVTGFLQQFRLAADLFTDLFLTAENHVQGLAGLLTDRLLIRQLAEIADGLASGFPGLLRRDGFPVNIQDAPCVLQSVSGLFHLLKFFNGLFQGHMLSLLVLIAAGICFKDPAIMLLRFILLLRAQR